MDTDKRLKARLAMMSDGAGGWITEAEEADIDEEAIAEIEEAHSHVQEAMGILEDEE